MSIYFLVTDWVNFALYMRDAASLRRHGISPPEWYQQAPTGEFPADRQLSVSNRATIKRAGIKRALFISPSFLCRNMLGCTVVFCLLTVMSPHGIYCGDVNITDVAEQTDNALAKLVKMFSKPGAFKQVSPEMSKVQISLKIK